MSLSIIYFAAHLGHRRFWLVPLALLMLIPMVAALAPITVASPEASAMARPAPSGTRLNVVIALVIARR
jgi:hypothetical protein